MSLQNGRPQDFSSGSGPNWGWAAIERTASEAEARAASEIEDTGPAAEDEGDGEDPPTMSALA